jgi:sec-independent protein translocase protein TatA
MANFGTTEILIVLLVIMLLFGSAKLPQLARSLGRSARILKTETKGLHDSEPAEDPPRPDGRQDPTPPLREEATHPERRPTAQPNSHQHALPAGRPLQHLPSKAQAESGPDGGHTRRASATSSG